MYRKFLVPVAVVEIEDGMDLEMRLRGTEDLRRSETYLEYYATREARYEGRCAAHAWRTMELHGEARQKLSEGPWPCIIVAIERWCGSRSVGPYREMYNVEFDGRMLNC